MSPLLANIPSWVWATLIMSAFVALSVITMVLVRLPIQRPRAAPRDSDEADAAPKSDRPC